jgi:hypothetical protein
MGLNLIGKARCSRHDKSGRLAKSARKRILVYIVVSGFPARTSEKLWN